MDKTELTQSERQAIRSQLVQLLINTKYNSNVASPNPVVMENLIKDAEKLESFILRKQ